MPTRTERSADRRGSEDRGAAGSRRGDLPRLRGHAGLEEAITAELGVPVIDGIGAAVRLAEAIVGLSLATSKVSTYAPPDPKQITGWPVSLALGLRSGTSRSDGYAGGPS